MIGSLRVFMFCPNLHVFSIVFILLFIFSHDLYVCLLLSWPGCVFVFSVMTCVCLFVVMTWLSVCSLYTVLFAVMTCFAVVTGCLCLQSWPVLQLWLCAYVCSHDLVVCVYSHRHDPQLQQKRAAQPMTSSLQDKQSGPVNGDECYFWRTTGCQFGNSCRWKHLKESKGRDRKPWQRQK